MFTMILLCLFCTVLSVIGLPLPLQLALVSPSPLALVSPSPLALVSPSPLALVSQTPCLPQRTVIGIIPITESIPFVSTTETNQISVSISILKVSAPWLAGILSRTNSDAESYSRCGYTMNLPQARLACGFNTYITALSDANNLMTLQDSVPTDCKNVYPIIIGGQPSPSYVFDNIPAFVSYTLQTRYVYDGVDTIDTINRISVNSVQLFTKAPWVINEQESFGGTAVVSLNCGMVCKYDIDMRNNFLILIDTVPGQECNSFFPLKFYPTIESSQSQNVKTI